MQVRLLTLEVEGEGSSLAPGSVTYAEELTVASTLVLENLDPTLCQFINHEREICHFNFNFGAIFFAFSGSDTVLILHIENQNSNYLQLTEWQVDTLPGLQDAIDISSSVEDDGTLKIYLLCDVLSKEEDYYERDVKHNDIKAYEKKKQQEAERKKRVDTPIDEEDEEEKMREDERQQEPADAEMKNEDEEGENDLEPSSNQVFRIYRLNNQGVQSVDMSDPF